MTDQTKKVDNCAECGTVALLVAWNTCMRCYKRERNRQRALDHIDAQLAAYWPVYFARRQARQAA